MRYDEVVVALTKRKIAGEEGISGPHFARRVSWKKDVLIFHGWLASNRKATTPELCATDLDKSWYYIPTESDKKATDWTFEVFERGMLMETKCYFDVKKELQKTAYCYAYREDWDDDHGMLAYDIVNAKFFLTDFGCEMGKWMPTTEDIQAKDWTIKRYIL